MQKDNVSAAEALQLLERGNLLYLNSKTGSGDVSPDTRTALSVNGQKPYAVIVACSDSRVVPEYVFSAGIGELFVVRVAGNVIEKSQLGSIQYAFEHLGCKLAVVLGHTLCGAVAAALGRNSGYVKFVTDEIKQAIGSETDAVRASVLNVQRGVEKIGKLLKLPVGAEVTGALYHTESGRVEFLGSRPTVQ